jgi:hypothetical protein
MGKKMDESKTIVNSLLMANVIIDVKEKFLKI